MIASYESDGKALEVFCENVHAPGPALSSNYRMIEAQMDALSPAVQCAAQVVCALVLKCAQSLSVHCSKYCNASSRVFFGYSPVCGGGGQRKPCRSAVAIRDY